jgi:hypothetical protein
VEKIDVAALIAQLEHLCQGCGGSGKDDGGGDILDCAFCDGSGYELTDEGKLFMEFISRHLECEGFIRGA